MFSYSCTNHKALSGTHKTLGGGIETEGEGKERGREREFILYPFLHSFFFIYRK